MSVERLQRISEIMKRNIDTGAFTGMVTLVARHGRVAHFEAHGLMDRESSRPMQKDALFRISSMTKPIVAVAVLILVEQGKIALDDPVSKFVPEMKSMNIAAGSQGTGRARREITIEDVLTHTAGFVTSQESELQARKLGLPGDTLATRVPRLAQLALDFQPGTRWAYSPSFAFDILARTVEVVSAQGFDQYLREHIFEPLGMMDSSFARPDGNPRTASLYIPGAGGLRKQSSPRVMNGVYFSASFGLVSTAHDYLRFAQMLLNGGALEGRRILIAKMLATMTAAHVTDKLPGVPSGTEFGLGVRMVRNPAVAGSKLSEGAYGWPGSFGTFFWVDPKLDLIAIFMGQMINTIPRQERPVRAEFEQAVMQSIAQ